MPTLEETASRPLTGLPTIIVPLQSLDAVQRVATDHDPYYEDLIEPHGNMNILLLPLSMFVRFAHYPVCDYRTSASVGLASTFLSVASEAELVVENCLQPVFRDGLFPTGVPCRDGE